jgi:hypothetical protein
MTFQQHLKQELERQKGAGPNDRRQTSQAWQLLCSLSNRAAVQYHVRTVCPTRRGRHVG